MSLARRFNDAVVAALNVERRIDPYVRPAFDRLFRERLADVTQKAINARRRHEPRLQLGEEREIPGEREAADQIVAAMSAFTHQQYDRALPALRAGNTKTHGVVRGVFEVHDRLADDVRHGLFATPKTYPAWVRFGGPGPLSPPDLKDNGVLSIGVKVMGVEGEKLLPADETRTQDFTGISAPTFTTPDVVENLKLQRWISKGTPLFYFVNPRDSHLLDMIMQGLYAKTLRNPLEERYWSCVPYLLGEQAMQYSFRPRLAGRTPFPKHPADNYLREAMAATLRRREAVFDVAVQLQTDPFRMPVENAAVRWPEKLSPYRTVATLRLPVQEFTSPAQLAFVDNLSFNPWHSLPEHRPLGNQNRARKTIYFELSKLRQQMNGTPRLEPTGDEAF